jgi:hypothetical protein
MVSELLLQHVGTLVIHLHEPNSQHGFFHLPDLLADLVPKVLGTAPITSSFKEYLQHS